MKKSLLLFCLLFAEVPVHAQNYSNYSNEQLPVYSEVLEDSVLLNLHVPETFQYSAKRVEYPLIIIFDSQHERTYPHMINSLDLLTSESQMPESVVVGVPFDRDNRYYRTSDRIHKNDSLSGIEKMEIFLFDELIPKLGSEYKAGATTIVLGHSRSAFLVNFLITKQSSNIDVAIALSGFYSNRPLSLDAFRSYISDDSNFPNRFRYYFTAGGTLEEETYLSECQNVADHISTSKMPENFIGRFSKNQNANHMTNYWVSVPPIFIDAFGDYNSILNNWFYIKLKGDALKNPVKAFRSDLAEAGANLGFEVNPSVVQIFSLASHFAYQESDHQTAIEFIKLGQKYYPGYADFDLTLMEFYEEIGNHEMAESYRISYQRKVAASGAIDEIEKH